MGFLKAEENHKFTTFDSVIVLALFVVVSALIVSIVSNATADQRELLAKERSQQLAIQILAGGYKSFLHDDVKLFTMSGRQPASESEISIPIEGRIGMDPWGKPYYYRILENSGKRSATVVSSGPNQVRDLGAGDDILTTVTQR